MLFECLKGGITRSLKFVFARKMYSGSWSNDYRTDSRGFAYDILILVPFDFTLFRDFPAFLFVLNLGVISRNTCRVSPFLCAPFALPCVLLFFFFLLCAIGSIGSIFSLFELSHSPSQIANGRFADCGLKDKNLAGHPAAVNDLGRSFEAFCDRSELKGRSGTDDILDENKQSGLTAAATDVKISSESFCKQSQLVISESFRRTTAAKGFGALSSWMCGWNIF